MRKMFSNIRLYYNAYTCIYIKYKLSLKFIQIIKVNITHEKLL